MQVDASQRPFKAQELRKVVQVLGAFMAASGSGEMFWSHTSPIAGGYRMKDQVQLVE